MTKTYYKRLVKSTIYKNNQDYKQKYNPDCFSSDFFWHCWTFNPLPIVKTEIYQKNLIINKKKSFSSDVFLLTLLEKKPLLLGKTKISQKIIQIIFQRRLPWVNGLLSPPLSRDPRLFYNCASSIIFDHEHVDDDDED